MCGFVALKIAGADQLSTGSANDQWNLQRVVLHLLSNSKCSRSVGYFW